MLSKARSGLSWRMGFISRELERWVPDHPVLNRLLIQNHARKRTGHYLPPPPTTSFNSLMMRAMMRDRDPVRAELVDKERVKAHVARVLGPAFTIPTLRLFRHARDIVAAAIPADCVVKPTHSSGRVYLRDGTAPIAPADLAAMRGWLGHNLFSVSRQWHYKVIEPGVIAEQRLRGADGGVPEDIKIFCAAGRPFAIQVDWSRFDGHRRDFYRPDGSPLDFAWGKPRFGRRFPAMAELPDLLEAASTLGRAFDMVRVDFYVVDGGLKVGEMTFFPGNCFMRFCPQHADHVFGRMYLDALRGASLGGE